MPLSDKSFPPRPPRPPSPPPPFPPSRPKNNHTVNRRPCCETFQTSCNVPSILQRAKHLATCQLSCKVTTSFERAIFYKLEEMLSIASRPAQKVTGKSSEQSIKSVSQAACACVGQKFPTPSPPPSFPPTPPHPKNNHTVIRRQCCETLQASCNVPSILQRANYLATCQLSCNVTASSKCAICDELQEKIRSIASRPAQKVTGKKFRAERQERVTTCMGLCRTKVSHPPTLLPPTLPPTPPSPPQK